MSLQFCFKHSKASAPHISRGKLFHSFEMLCNHLLILIIFWFKFLITCVTLNNHIWGEISRLKYAQVCFQKYFTLWKAVLHHMQHHSGTDMICYFQPPNIVKKQRPVTQHNTNTESESAASTSECKFDYILGHYKSCILILFCEASKFL